MVGSLQESPSDKAYYQMVKWSTPPKQMGHLFKQKHNYRKSNMGYGSKLGVHTHKTKETQLRCAWKTGRSFFPHRLDKQMSRRRVYEEFYMSFLFQGAFFSSCKCSFLGVQIFSGFPLQSCQGRCRDCLSSLKRIQNRVTELQSRSRLGNVQKPFLSSILLVGL